MTSKINLIYFFVFNCLLFLQIKSQNLNPNGIGVCSFLNETTGSNQFHCCNGYRISYFADFNHESFTGDCEPVCADDCYSSKGHGNCIAPNKCSCMIGFGGKFCDKICSPGTFGENCEFNCKEILNDVKYTSRSCDCEKNQMNDEQCRNKCKCILNKCDPGLIGLNCNEKCPKGKFGDFCSEDCVCDKENTVECNDVNGQCKCKKNFFGKRCESYCNGILNCTEINNCICESTLNQKIQDLIDHKNLITNNLSILSKNNEKIEKDIENNQNQINELNNKNSLIENRLLIKLSELDNKLKEDKNSLTIKDDLELMKKILLIAILSVIIILILFISLILNQTCKIKNLEKKIKSLSIKNDNLNQEYSLNQLYDLSNSSAKKPINCNYKTKESFLKSRPFNDNYPSLINRESTTSDMYESIDEIKNKINKFNQSEW